MTSISKTKNTVAAALVGVLLLHGAADVLAQARTARRGGAVKTEEGGAAVGRRGAAVKTDEGAAAVTRRGAAVKTEEGVKTVPRYGAPVPRGGAVVHGEEATAAVGRRGAVVVGEEGAAAVGRYGYRGGAVVYEDNDAWKVAAGVAVGVAAGIAIGTMMRKPPKQATTVVVSNTTYYYDNGTYYSKAMSSGEVVYQVVQAPPGAIIVDAAGRLLSHTTLAGLPIPSAGRRTTTACRRATRSWCCSETGRRRALLGRRCPRRCWSRWPAHNCCLRRRRGLSPWKGGGFGMFASLDARPFRYVRIFVEAPGRSEELAVPPSLEELAASAEIAARRPPARTARAGSRWPGNVAGSARSSTCGWKCGASSSRPGRSRRAIAWSARYAFHAAP